jgi:Flp pilus assembly protein TadG
MKELWWSRLRRSKSGMGAIEMALIAPVLLAMFLGILDFGMGYWQQMQVTNAADAGVEWAMQNGYNATSIISVAQSASYLPLSSSDISPSNPYGCVVNSQLEWYSKTATCPDGTTPQPYVVVATRVCYSTIFKWPGLTYCSSSNSSCSGCNSNQIVLTAQSIVAQ